MFVVPRYITLHGYMNRKLLEYLGQDHFISFKNIIPGKVCFMHIIIHSKQAYRPNALEGALALVRLLVSSKGFYTFPVQLCLIHRALLHSLE